MQPFQWQGFTKGHHFTQDLQDNGKESHWDPLTQLGFWGWESLEHDLHFQPWSSNKDWIYPLPLTKTGQEMKKHFSDFGLQAAQPVIPERRKINEVSPVTVPACC